MEDWEVCAYVCASVFMQLLQRQDGTCMSCNLCDVCV